MTYSLTFLENATAQQIVVGITRNVSSFIPLMLLFEFLIIALGGSIANGKKTGYTNFIQWAALASLVTTTTAIIIGGVFIQQSDWDSYIWMVVTCIAITVLFALGALWTKDEF